MKAHGFTLLTVLLALPAMAQPATSSLAASNADELVSATPQTYVPKSKDTDFTLGAMRLSASFASFSLLRGHMALSFKGEMGEPDGLGIGNMRMYRVTNAADYWKANKGKNGFCRHAVEWLGVTPMTYGWVRISFFEMGGRKGLLDEGVGFLANEKGGLGMCSADSFVLKTAK